MFLNALDYSGVMYCDTCLQAVQTCVDRPALVIICMPRQRDGAHAHLTVNLYIYILTPSAAAFSWMRV